jgi:DNA-binding response OmpR family regulator
MMKILVVEDDEKVAGFIKENLAREGYGLQLISNMNDLLTFIEERPFHPKLIILDRLLGNKDTKDHLKKIRTRFPESSLMFLSALNTPSEKAALLDEGADDYLGKPFSLIELQARVRALLRRSGSSGQTYLSLGNVTIDLKGHQVISGSKRIDFTKKEYALLVHFAQNENRVFSKFQLMDIIWETNLDIESNVLEVTIMNLRKKLDEYDSGLKISSKRNVGYWLET